MNTRKRRKRVLIPTRDERGMVLVVTLLVTVLMSLVGITFLSVSGAESTIAFNEVRTARAFYLAESGVQHAKRALRDLNLSQVLDGTTSVFPGGNTVNLAGGSYTVEVTNNFGAGFPLGTIPADPSGSATVDGDSIIVVKSTGTLASSQQDIEMILQVNPSAFNVVSAIAQVSNGENELDVEDSTLASGFEESGTCPDLPGFVWKGDDLNLDLEGGVLEGAPVDYREYDPAIDNPLFGDPDALLSLVSQWMSLPGVVTISGDSPPATLGTAASPQITVWNVDDDNVEPPYTVTGYGILIITGELRIETDFEFHGLVIVKTDEEFTLGKGSGSHNQYVHGALIAVSNLPSDEDETEIDLENEAQVLYNCSAITTYAQPLVGGVGSGSTSLLSWREVF